MKMTKERLIYEEADLHMKKKCCQCQRNMPEAKYLKAKKPATETIIWRERKL